MFPNQQGRDSWGSVAGYYGNYGMHAPSLSGGVAGNSWYNRAAAGQSGAGAGWSAWGVGAGAGYSTEGMTGDEANERAMMASLSSMEREAAAEMMVRSESFSQQSQRPKLGINSNIYSLYQTKQSRLGDSTQGYGGSMSDSLYKSSLPSTKSPELIHKPEPESDSVYVSDQRQSFDESQDISRDAHLRHSISSNCSDKQQQMYSSCMQQVGTENIVTNKTGTETEETVVTTMEPDSSTDGVHPAGKHVTNGVVSNNKDATESDLEEENDSNEDRMQKLLKEHARLFNNVKNEPEGSSYDGAKRLKTYKTAQEELAELMKLTNEKLFKNANTSRSSLPLSVEIEAEQDSSSDSVSPPRNPFMITNSLNPRKRGRKPKHYSEILYELGQRGISITKTAKSGQGPGPGPSCSGPGVGPGHNPTEMVVSENGSVSHKASGQQLKCPHCNKILTTSVGLMYHIRLHTGEKPYSCDICGKSFATSSHYHYHIRSHSGEKPYRNFRCDFCGKMYTASGSLRLHLKSHLSRLAANAFSSMSLPGFNMSQNFASLAGADPLQVGQNEFKFGIKQEVFENNDASEVNDNIKDDGSGYPKENSETIRKSATVDEEH